MLTNSENIQEFMSMCPLCAKLSVAKLVIKEDKIYQRIFCDQHGINENLIFSDAKLFDKIEKWNERIHSQVDAKEDLVPCSADCLKCKGHNQPTALAIIDIT